MAMERKQMSGKGSRIRPYNKKVFDTNYDIIFKSDKNIVYVKCYKCGGELAIWNSYQCVECKYFFCMGKCWKNHYHVDYFS